MSIAIIEIVTTVRGNFGQCFAILVDSSNMQLNIKINAVSGRLLQNICIDAANNGKHLMDAISEQPRPAATGVWELLFGSMRVDMCTPLAAQGVVDGSIMTLVFDSISEEEQFALLRKMDLGGCLDDGDEREHAVWNSIKTLHWPWTCLSNAPLPRSLEILTFGPLCKRSLGSALPYGLKSLTFGEWFDQRLSNTILPDTLQHLTFGMHFNTELDDATLPIGLQSLTFGDDFNKKLDNVTLPSCLQSLTFGESYDWELDNTTLPNGLQNLTFGKCFNQKMDNTALPSGLQHLTCGWSFDKDLDNTILPSHFKSLTFGVQFNQSLDKVTLPSGLQSLTFGKCFNQKVADTTLPSGLQNLKFDLSTV